MAYTVDVTLDGESAAGTKVRSRFRQRQGMAILTGKCNITSYHQTLAEITEITKQFRTILQVAADPVSDNGHMFRWNRTSKAFEAYKPVSAHTHVIPVTTGTAGDNVTNNAGVLESSGGQDLAASANTIAAGVEAANDTDVGEVGFIAVGLL